MAKYEDFRVSLENRVEQKVRVAKGRGAVASVSGQGSELGIKVLKDGGNAFDAAFAVAFGLTIYHPQAGNIGGGGYLVYKQKGKKRPCCMNYRELSPAGVKREHFVDEHGNADPDRTAYGPKSVCVPGTVKAFFTLQKEHGKLAARDILFSLAALSEKGCRITHYQAECLNRLNEKLSRSPESKMIYGQKGRQYREGDSLINVDLGGTFRILAQEGERAFYEGEIAESIESDLADNGGILSVDDLKSFSIKMVEPIATELNGTTVWTVPPEGGGALLIQILKILNRDQFTRLVPFSAEFYHHLTQAFKMASIDRLFYLGDIFQLDNEIYKTIFNRSYAEKLFSLIESESDLKTERLLSLMHPDDRDIVEEVETHTGAETTHFSIMDSDGNAVSNSYTLNLRYGSKWSVAGRGFLLNGSMDAFSFSPGKPNYFGVIGNKPNLLAPNKRPASNMAPVLVTKGNEVDMVLGTPGGPSIPTSMASILFLLISHRMKPEIVLQLGRVHHQGWPDVLIKEKESLSYELITEMKKKGYIIQDKNEPIGDVHGVFKDGKEHVAVSDYRREGCPSVL
jgi:gamma-glutamyltranspeptidase/glutathione hydrolase